MAINNSVIDKIIESEKLAQAVMDVARNERRTHEASLRSEIEAYRAAVGAETEAAIGAHAKAQKALSDQASSKANKDADERIALIRSRANANGAEWADKLFRGILEGSVG